MFKKLCIAGLLIWTISFNSAQAQQESFLGEVKMFAGNYAPKGWALCDGQTIAISSNTALFSILGTTYGGDGRTTFNLPDMRSRVAIHQGTGPGLPNYKLGQKGGSPTYMLQGINLPNTIAPSTIPALVIDLEDENATFTKGNASFIATGNSPNAIINSTAARYNQQPVSIMQPYLTINYIICVAGIYPSRN